jgi:hypothetical protein
MSGLLALCGKAVQDATGSKVIYWHRELPPFDAEAMGEHVVEAASGRVPVRWLIATSCGANVTTA